MYLYIITTKEGNAQDESLTGDTCIKLKIKTNEPTTMKDTARKLAYLNTENKQKEEKTFPENLNHKPVHADMQSDSYH